MQTRNLKARLEIPFSSKYPKLSQNRSMEPLRGNMGTEFRSLRDGTPNPTYLVELAAAIKLDLITGGALKIEAKNLKQVQGLNKSYLKHYATFGNLVSS